MMPKNSKINIEELFSKYDKRYFDGILRSVNVSWSPRMTLCTGKTYFNQRENGNTCTIRLSQPLLSQRPYKDTVNTLLHEMIHAYLLLKYGKERGSGHGENFKNFIKKINQNEGTAIKVYHNFHKEVNKFKIHIYKCDGPCRYKKPFYGTLKRAITRPPGPEDKWWSKHSFECGGTFHKVSEAPSVEVDDHPVNRTSFSSSSQTLFTRQDKTDIKMQGTSRLKKGNVNVNYSSEVKHLNIKKYIDKYIEYSQKANCTSKVSNLTCFRQSLDSNVKKYINNLKNSL